MAQQWGWGMNFKLTNKLAVPNYKGRTGTKGAGSRRAYLKYPFAEMQVGQSFVVSAEDADRVRCAAIKWSKRRIGYKFSVVKDGKVFRCGRIE